MMHQEVGGEPNNVAALSSCSMNAATIVRQLVCPREEVVDGNSLFLAGGITSCLDWQASLLKLLADLDLTVFNPRRQNFPIDDPRASMEQIHWEHRSLRSAKAVSFWFPEETECPITMYECGTYLMSAKPVFVGINPNFPRRTELVAHIEAIRPKTTIVYAIHELAEQIRSWQSGADNVDLPVALSATQSRSLFLRGGIRSCPDWQQEILEQLSDADICITNPRKASFSAGSSDNYQKEVAENYCTSRLCEGNLFWFPRESLTPVALFELGVVSQLPGPLFVGVYPEYKRRIDVEIQTKLVRPEIEIVYSLEELAQQLCRQYGKVKPEISSSTVRI